MKNGENKWIGWVEDAEGYMVRFIGPTSQAWAVRKCREAQAIIGSYNAPRYSWVQLNYAVRNELSGRVRGDKWFARLNEADLNVLINVVQG
jgi:hypothetical protein